MVCLGPMRSGDSDYVEIIDKFSSLIKAIIIKNLFQSRIDPEDIEQEVKFKLWKYLKKGKKIDNLPSFIMKAAYTITMDELRKLKKQMPPRDIAELKNLYLVSESFPRNGVPDSPGLRMERNELSTQMYEAIGMLSENRKQVLQLYVRGMTVDEICSFCNWDRVKVRHFLYRGIEDLRGIFSGKSIRLETAEGAGEPAQKGPETNGVKEVGKPERN
jgi:RNA polymerase sigma factor (sigma-70 family)